MDDYIPYNSICIFPLIWDEIWKWLPPKRGIITSVMILKIKKYVGISKSKTPTSLFEMPPCRSCMITTYKVSSIYIVVKCKGFVVLWQFNTCISNNWFKKKIVWRNIIFLKIQTFSFTHFCSFKRTISTFQHS